MKVPFSWLKQYVDIDVTAQELEDKLFDCGFEVEERIDLGADIHKVVVGVVTDCVPQEGTHLHICKVDCGEYGHAIQISTGAPNVYAGMHTAAALDGSTLPGGIKIKAKPLMGVESNGMLCSGEELGLNEDLYPGAEVYGLLDLPKDTVPGTPIQQVVGLDDSIFDISITANRADCQSVLGIAREVAAALGKPLTMPATDYTVSGYVDEKLSITVEAPDLCPRYLGHYVRNITPGTSPRWMRRQLALCGLRSISNVVDITNYVMLEIGQPMHAFDMDTLESHQIIVRRAAEGEGITTLDGKEFTLTPDNLVICDGHKPVALAGIMGGLNSEIKDTTTQLLFESAKFARDNIRKTARSLGQNTDASSHYEKGISEYTTELGMARALHLIQELGCGEVTSTHFDCSAGAPREGKRFTAKVSGINAILGITVPTDVILDILNRLHAGEDFEELLAEHNTDPGMESYPEGYLVGEGASFIEEFLTAALALKKEGDLSEIVESSSGFHIIKRLADETGGVLPYGDVQERFEAYAKSKFIEDYYAKLLESWKQEEGLVTYYEENFRGIGKAG